MNRGWKRRAVFAKHFLKYEESEENGDGAGGQTAKVVVEEQVQDIAAADFRQLQIDHMMTPENRD